MKQRVLVLWKSSLVHLEAENENDGEIPYWYWNTIYNSMFLFADEHYVKPAEFNNYATATGLKIHSWEDK